MATELRVGGAEGTIITKITKGQLLEKIRQHPRRYRVGATTQSRIDFRVWNYEGEYNNKQVYYARTIKRSCLRTWENEALALLAEDQQYNIQTSSNLKRRKKGFLYIIDMQ